PGWRHIIISAECKTFVLAGRNIENVNLWVPGFIGNVGELLAIRRPGRRYTYRRRKTYPEFPYDLACRAYQINVLASIFAQSNSQLISSRSPRRSDVHPRKTADQVSGVAQHIFTIDFGRALLIADKGDLALVGAP